MRLRPVVLLLKPACVLIVLALAPSLGSAQTLRIRVDPETGPPNSNRAGDSRPPFNIDVGALTPSGADVPDTTRDPALFGRRDRLWEFRSGAAHEFGKGVVASAQVVGRRGYGVPLYLSDALGADRSTVDVGNTSIIDMSQFAVDWTAKVRIEKRFVQRKWDMRVVGELIAPLAYSDRTAVNPSTGVLSSRAIRVGIVLGF